MKQASHNTESGRKRGAPSVVSCRMPLATRWAVAILVAVASLAASDSNALGDYYRMKESYGVYLVNSLRFDDRVLAEMAVRAMNLDYRFRQSGSSTPREATITAYEELITTDTSPGRRAFYAQRLGQLYGCFRDEANTRTEDWEKAIEWWEKATLWATPEESLVVWEARTGLATMHAYFGRRAHAIEELAGLLAIQPSGATTLGASAQRRLNRLKRSVVTALKNNGKHIAPGVALVAIQETIGHEDEAISQAGTNISDGVMVTERCVNPLELPEFTFR